MRRAATILAAMTALCGCATAPPIQTASGSPEVTIPGASAEKIKPVIINAMLNRRLRIKSDTPYSIVVEKQTEDFTTQLLLGTAYGPPIERVTFAIAEIAGGTRIVADASMVSNAGTAFERQTFGQHGSLNGPALQSLLDEIAASVRGQKTR